jgi:hypothetical protein
MRYFDTALKDRDIRSIAAKPMLCLVFLYCGPGFPMPKNILVDGDPPSNSATFLPRNKLKIAERNCHGLSHVSIRKIPPYSQPFATFSRL